MLHPPSEDAKHVTSYTESTILAAWSEDDLQTIVNEGRVPARSTYGLPCHNQRVERAIKLVTEISLKAAKKVDHEGIIQTAMASRRELPEFEKKKQFKMKLKFK